MIKRVRAVQGGRGFELEESAAVQGCRQNSLQLINRHGRMGSMVKLCRAGGGGSREESPAVQGPRKHLPDRWRRKFLPVLFWV